MSGPATEGETGRRVGPFCVGLAVAVLAAFVGWAAFALPTEDSAAEGWATARSRLASDPPLAAVVGLSAVVVGAGLVVMGWAVLGRPGRTEPDAAPDPAAGSASGTHRSPARPGR